MKIIFHSCTDGYITELRLEDNCSRIFFTMQACFEYARNFVKDVAQIPQEHLEHTYSKWEVSETIRREREVE